MAAVLDAFAAPATPEFRRERPALVRARLRWAARRLAAQRDQVGGLGAGDRVLVELAPGQFWTGEIEAWIREPACTLARVRLDPGHPSLSHVLRRRHLLVPLSESKS